MVVSTKSLDFNNLVNTAVFKVVDTACFLWKNMDDAHIIYDKRSGHSQVMNDFAREVFDIIADKPCRLSDIMTEVQKILEQILTDELKLQVRKTVMEFDKMGLIEPVISENENK
ncbi:MAG: hypothetical protein COB49_09010 [Alphaproteobacteria bacterium]|nr:MAG: hypothetical protein COB49_09010 [Alphaproteobacteria bacterium]